MSQMETVLEREPSLDKVEKELEHEETPFVEVKSPEEINNDLIREKRRKRVNGALTYVGVFGGSTASIYPIALMKGVVDLGVPNKVTLGTIGLAATAGTAVGSTNFAKSYSNSQENIKELESESENWCELPGQVDLSYLVEDGIARQIETPYDVWQDENISEWASKSLLADLVNQELEELKIEGVRQRVSSSGYGKQRIYLEKFDEDEELYKFILETYDADTNEQINAYWGLTDEKGRHIVENNDAVKQYDPDLDKFI